MKAILEFDMDEPGDRESHSNAVNGTWYKCALEEMDNYLRSRLKYEELPEEANTVLQDARDRLNQLVREATE